MAISKARASKGSLLPPATTSTPGAQRRKEWLDKAFANFAQPSPANRAIYEVLLLTFWPEGHGIPGPVRTQNDIRAAVDAWYQEKTGKSGYKDVFRRLRELQGEEGFTCIIKEGIRYQLVSLDVSAKREPRASLGRGDWNHVREIYGFKCAHCGTAEPLAKLSPDHKKPRNRGGGNELENIQPLCEQCNINKSSACQGCQQNCFTCPWAYPLEHKPITINDANKEQIRRLAEKEGVYQSDLANRILTDYFTKKR